MWPKYEEKTYENYFNAELAQRSNIYFPLGQVQEGFLGFDSSAFSLNAELWRRLGFPFISFPLFPGVNTRDLERFMGYMFDELPPFKANLLFQYKRPELITLSSGSEWHQWSKPYYRYKIYQEQQQLLMLIHGAFSDQVLTLYAAPAIFDVRELAQKSMDRRIIEFSNFQQCHRLDGHHLNTFTEAGTHSVACSDPENLENVNLLALLDQLADTNLKFDSNRSFIINFRRGIVNVISEYPYYSQIFKTLIANLPAEEQYPLINSLMVLRQFKWLTGIQWLIKL